MDRIELIGLCRALTPGRSRTFLLAEIAEGLPEHERPEPWTVIAELFGELSGVGEFGVAEECGGTITVMRLAP